MEIILLIILTLPIIFMAFKSRKPYLYIMCAFYPILPDTFAIEISSILPLLTAKRILILLGLFIVVYRDEFKIKVHLPRYFTVFISVELLIQLINLRYGFGEINNIFIILFEQLLLVVIMIKLITDNETMHKCLSFVVYGSILNALAGIFQTIFSLDITKVLALVEIRTEGGLAPRMGLDRAYGFQDNAISFACVCAFMLLLSEYLYRHSKKRIYLLSVLINMISIFCSMTRSVILALIIIYTLRIIYNIREFIRKYMLFVILAIIVFSIMIVAIPGLQIVLEPIKSIANIFGGNFKLSSDFGLNADDPTNSRLYQWSSIIYMIQEMKGLFGYGYNGYINGNVYYYYPQYNCWAKAVALDVGFLGTALTFGITGLINLIIFLLKLLRISTQLKNDNNRINDLFYYVLLLVVFLNFASAFCGLEIFWIFVGIFVVNHKSNLYNRC